MTTPAADGSPPATKRSGPDGPSITVAICSFNRAELLSQTLDSVLPRTLGIAAPGGGQLEVLVVDNNSTDGTAAVVAAHRQAWPTLRYVVETAPGLSCARNRALQEASHDVVAFLDDDVELHDDWLCSMQSAFADPAAAVVGGRVLPYAVALPPWLPDDLKGCVSVLDPPDDSLRGVDLIGANIALRKSLLGEQAYFDARLGRRGRTLIGGEESDLLFRVRRRGLAVKFRRSSIVYHKIGDKLTESYVMKFAYWHGVCDLMRDRSCRRYLRRALKTVRSLAVLCGLFFVRLSWSHSPADRMRERFRYRYAVGYVGANFTG